MNEFQPPLFEPHRWLRGGHLQTLVGVRSVPATPLSTQQHFVDLLDGDAIVLHEDRPTCWQAGDASMLLVHGLSGCHQSPYMLRLATHWFQRGFRVFRMDMRGCGAAATLCSQVTHAGRSDDVMAALTRIAEISSSGPLLMTAVSLGGNQALRAVGRVGAGIDSIPDWFSRLERIAVVAPPLDLTRCSHNMNRWRMWPYNYYFIRSLLMRIPDKVSQREDYQQHRKRGMPRTLWQLDDQITAPLSGFSDAAEYYRESSAKRVMHQLPIPTLVLVAEDDPIVPIGCFTDESANWSPMARLVVAQTGGHVGFIDQRGQCWMDEVLTSWFD
jgi:predicted alpha/beta-fold hydrolase